MSARFESEHPKQLADFGGEPLVRRTARQALVAELGELVVVIGYAAEAVAATIADLPVRIVENAEYARVEWSGS